MNKLMLNGDSNNWMKIHIDKATCKIIENWKNQIKNNASISTNRNTVEIYELEEQLYRWSIDGKICINKIY